MTAYAFVIFINIACLCSAYKPIFMIHGILTGNSTMIEFAETIRQIHAGTEIYVSSRFLHWDSLESMMQQTIMVGADMMKFSEHHPEGFHLIGYSQGGLVARAILEYFPNHNVHTFISLSSPQAGQYGDKFLHLIFRSLICRDAYRVFYTETGQYISVANYWKDPYHQDLYYERSNFLPYINNEKRGFYNESFKAGIAKLQKMVLIGGPDDGIISPWQSSHFSYFDDEVNVTDMRNSTLYQKDLFGLRTLDDSRRLFLVTVSGVHHHFWHRNKTVLKQNILPWLT